MKFARLGQSVVSTIQGGGVIVAFDYGEPEAPLAKVRYPNHTQVWHLLTSLHPDPDDLSNFGDPP